MAEQFNVPQGFRYSGSTCGIKKSGKPDLALIVADEACPAAGVYTTNVVHATSIDWNRTVTPSGKVRALVVNSGNANACTGEQGERDNREMASLVAKELGCEPNQILVMSTGIIGEFLPMEKLRSGIPAGIQKLAAGGEKFLEAATAIMTTDQYRKTHSRTIQIGNSQITFAGMAKGAGMIGPNMATMLSCFVTDAALSAEQLQDALAYAADRSFNAISVEGHMSTSDALVLFASGKSGVKLEGESYLRFREELTEACIGLAKLIPNDGEGATHLIELQVSGCRSEADARLIARNIANSALVKTAILGADPNWGRIVSGAGYAGVQFDPKKVSLKINGYAIFENGSPTKFDASLVSKSIADQRDTLLQLSLGEGTAKTTFWTSDLTVDYVKFNSDYHT